MIATYCLHGHRMTRKNTYIDPTGRRRCRACRDAATVRWMAAYPEERRAYKAAWIRDYRARMREARP